MEPNFDTNSWNGATRLDDWACIAARGPDAAKFLHSQLSQDIALMPAGQARLAGFCSAKGRLMATMMVWREGAQDIMLALPASVAAGVLKRLSMFVMRSQCKLSLCDTPMWGLVGGTEPRQAWLTTQSDLGAGIQLPSVQNVPRSIFVGTELDGPTLPKWQWDWLDVSSALPWIVAETQELFVPQMVNFESVGGVNFKKGCYPGQEVVARSQLRGTLKRRMYLLEGSVSARPGQDVSANADAVGTVVSCATAPNGMSRVLAQLQIDAVNQGQLTIDGNAVKLLPLPYELMQDI